MGMRRLYKFEKKIKDSNPCDECQCVYARYTEMLQGGMNGHISKPLYLEDLKDRIIQII